MNRFGCFPMVVGWCVLLLFVVSCNRKVDHAENTDEKGLHERGDKAIKSATSDSGQLEHGVPSSTRAVDDLLDKLVRSSGDESVQVWTALKKMQSPDLSDRAMAKLKTQTDPRKKVILISIVADYGSAEAVRGLLEYLNDRRESAPRCRECPPFSNPLRVCDVVFNKLAFRLAACGLLHESNIMQSSNLRVLRMYPPNHNFNEIGGVFPEIRSLDPYPARDQAIAALRQYYQTNWTNIVTKFRGESRPVATDKGAP